MAELKLVVSHRYEGGVRQAVAAGDAAYLAHLGRNHTVALHYLRSTRDRDLCLEPPEKTLFDEANNTISIIGDFDSNYSLFFPCCSKPPLKNRSAILPDRS